MARLQQVLIERLTGNSDLMAVLTGGVWNRPILQAGPGNTAGMWTANANGVLHLRPSASVLIGDENADPSNWTTARAIGVVQPVPLFIYAEATDDGNDAILAADLLTQRLFMNWQAVADDGIYTLRPSGDRVGPTDNSTYPGTRITQRRFAATTARILAEVA